MEIGDKREEVEQMLKIIESGEIDQISKTDKDSRMMKQGRRWLQSKL